MLSSAPSKVVPSSAPASSQEMNWLIAALPDEARQSFLEQCKMVELPLRSIIVPENQPIEHVFFPVSGTMSVVTVHDGEMKAEVGSIGLEGMSSISLFHRIERTPIRTIVQIEGRAYRMSASDFTAQLRSSRAVLTLVNRYAQYWSEQSAYGVGCNGLHSIEQRCARWLLHTHDRVGNSVIPLTQEFLALMLAVRRASVSVAAEALQKAGVITYARGKISIVDREGLEAASCYCYKSIQ